ncbi:MAG: energy transducer TonB [bacterium]
MTDRPRVKGAGGGDPLRSLSARGRREAPEERSLLRDKRFRIAWGVSLFLHVLLFTWATWAPSAPRFRYFGSGTAVSLVGAHEIPGGSARGKAGDRPEVRPQRKPPPPPPAKKAKAKNKKPARKVKKKIAKRKKPPRPKPALKKKPEARALKRKKKTKPKKRVVHRKGARERRERMRRWRKRFNRDQKRKPLKEEAESAPAPQEDAVRPPAKAPVEVAKLEPPPEPSRPRQGFPGEGGGEGQGGGSRGGGGGGVARTELERYYGLLAERVRNHWTIPLSLENVENLRATVSVDVARDGRIRDLRIEKPSGNQFYDKATLRAVAKSASPAFPPPPNTVTQEWLLLGFRFCGRNFCRE